MTEDGIYQRIKGALIGCAYGDAMGMPTEMMTRSTLHQAFPDGIKTFEPSSKYDFFGRSFCAGTVTDDTINTLLVCDTIIENEGQFKTEAYIAKLEKWIQGNAAINPYIIGPSTAKALQAIQKGTPIQEAGKYGTTNGAVMKVSPIGMIYDYRDKKMFVDKVESLCMPTHHTNIAIAGACFAAGCVSYAIRNGESFHGMIDAAYILMKEGMKRGNPLPCASLERRISAVKELLKTESNTDFNADLEHLFGTGMETIETIPAVYAVLAEAKCMPAETARLSANLSGDSDTIGAISTAIAGAFHPEFDAAEVNMLSKINNINFDEYASKLRTFVQ
jgi:ADP-ribosylglycohydrolase